MRTRELPELALQGAEESDGTDVNKNIACVCVHLTMCSHFGVCVEFQSYITYTNVNIPQNTE